MLQYSVLTYNHSLSLGEQLNIGLLVYSEKSEVLEFLYPKSLKRLSGFYHNLSIKFLKHYLHDFEKKANDLKKIVSDSLLKEKDLEKIIYDYFLIPDSNSLRFTEVKKVKETDFDKLKQYYYNTFLGNYEENKKTTRKDEGYILHKIRDYINNYSPDIKNKLRQNVKITNKERGIELDIDLAWQNGSYNLVTPVGFDLNDKQHIIDKATKWYGTLTFLREPEGINNFKFDILSTKPTKRDLYKSYDQALRIIDDANTPKKIYEENSIEDYLDELITTAK